MMKARMARVMLALLAVAVAVPGGRAEAQSAEVVYEWNQLLQATIPTNASLRSTRYYAILHVAIFDAVNSIERDFTPYHVRVNASHGASSEAAAAQAAHDILTALIGAQTRFDDALNARLATIPRGQARQGVRVGQKVAEAILKLRQTDGWDVVGPAFVLPPFPGLWQPVPGAAAFTQFPKVTPFATLSPTQFLPPPPPTLTSATYATDLDEVLRFGVRDSTERTTDQTRLARLWAGEISTTPLFAVWNNVARDTARSRGLCLSEVARLFALLNMSIHDGLQTSHTAKFVYGLWRPVTAIKRAAEDLNDATTADPTWIHQLLVTPPYPSYPGNMQCVGASAATALARVFGTNDIPVSPFFAGTAPNPDVTLEYPGFLEMAVDQGNSRIYGGIHFRFDNNASLQFCPRVVDFIVANYMLPK